jgi:hypothetical protein
MMRPLPDTASPQRRALVVLGMHRGGTSAIAGCLQRLGVDFGPRLMPANPDNARGYYEHLDIVRLHDRLLLNAGTSWDDASLRPPGWLDAEGLGRFREELSALLARDFGAAPLWGIKDPRLCRLLPWWAPVWEELGSEPLFVIALRDPRQVAASLGRRDGMTLPKAYRLWLLHLLEAERESRGRQRVFLNFSEFLEDWPRAFEPLGSALGQPWPVSPPESALDDGFVDGSLPKSNRAPAEGDMPPWVEEVDAVTRTGRPDEAQMRAVLDRVYEAVRAGQALFGAGSGNAEDLAGELAALRTQAQWYEAEWQKARRRTEGWKERLERKADDNRKLQNRILILEESIAKMRIANLAKMRKRGGLRGLFSRFFRAS